MGGVPSKPNDPSRRLEVIGAGFSRTGTVTMQLALEELLRGPVLHGATHIIFGEKAFGKKWTQVYEAREEGEKARTLDLLRELVEGFAGVTDLPAIDSVPELMELYPDAKVVLVTRQRNRWWENFGKVLSVIAASMHGLRWFPGSVVYWHKGASRLMEEEKCPGTPLELIELHNARVKLVVPPDESLAMSMKECCDPLVRFWGKKTPAKPSPHLSNAGASKSVA